MARPFCSWRAQHQQHILKSQSSTALTQTILEAEIYLFVYLFGEPVVH